MRRSRNIPIDRRGGGFTLIELLVVIAIIGIMAAIGVPALKGLGGTNDIAAANRQLRDDLSYARLRAINDRTTVYVVFVGPNLLKEAKSWNNAERIQVAKYANLQYTGYALFAKRSLGDQPGPGTPHYLTEWRTLPEGTFITTNKFVIDLKEKDPGTLAMSIRPFLYDPNVKFPFPNVNSRTVPLHYIAFDYRGRLADDLDVVLPISKGSIVYPQESREKAAQQSIDPAEVIETPKNNYTNNPVIRIDWVTGRARTIQPEKFDYAAIK
jgi:prepilin-type N-terminal cleavage/methylation domain-containing protein